MKFSLVLLSITTLAMAAPRAWPGAERSFVTFSRPTFPTAKSAKSGKTISKALKTVATAVGGLDTAVKAVMGPMGINGIADVAMKGAGLGDVIKNAQTMIAAQSETDLVGALDIADSADGLTKNLDTLSNDLIAIEPIVRMAKLNSAVIGILQQQQGSAGGLVSTVVSKIPDEAKDIAKDQTKGATAGLDRVLAAYMAGLAKTPARKVRRSVQSAPLKRK